MNNLNNEFKIEEIDILKNLLNKKLIKIKHDEFLYSPSVLGKVSFYFDDGNIYQLKTKLEYFDNFLWGEDEIVYFEFKKCEESETETEYTSANKSKSLITPINKVLKDIILVKDNIKAFDIGKKQFGEYTYIKAILFKFEDLEFLFSLDVVFMEDITVLKGRDLLSKLTPIEKDENWSDWSDGNYSINTRTLISIKSLI